MRKIRALEKDFLARFTRRVKKAFPGGFYYKIPDTKGLGGKRPFDSFWIISGITFCLEFKRSDAERATDYQIHHLGLADKNGATTFVICPENAEQIYGYITRRVNKR